VKRAFVVGLVVVVGAVGGLLWWMANADSPPPLSIDDVAAAAGGEGRPTGSTAEAPIDGRWVVQRGEDTVAGLRIGEERAAGLGNHTAVGRTGAVDGSLEVADGRVLEGSFVVDLGSIEFTDDPGLPVANRSAYLRTRGLETDEFPDARFTTLGPVPLPVFEDGVVRGAIVAGSLEIHGVERTRTLRVDVRVSGNQVVLGTSEPVPVRLADHDIDVPEVPGVAKVADEGEFEFVVVLRLA
jgi:polyisoprenoid-binding protein YceI